MSPVSTSRLSCGPQGNRAPLTAGGGLTSHPLSPVASLLLAGGGTEGREIVREGRGGEGLVGGEGESEGGEGESEGEERVREGEGEHRRAARMS